MEDRNTQIENALLLQNEIIAYTKLGNAIKLLRHVVATLWGLGYFFSSFFIVYFFTTGVTLVPIVWLISVIVVVCSLMLLSLTLIKAYEDNERYLGMCQQGIKDILSKSDPESDFTDNEKVLRLILLRP